MPDPAADRDTEAVSKAIPGALLKRELTLPYITRGTVNYVNPSHGASQQKWAATANLREAACRPSKGGYRSAEQKQVQICWMKMQMEQEQMKRRCRLISNSSRWSLQDELEAPTPKQCQVQRCNCRYRWLQLQWFFRSTPIPKSKAYAMMVEATKDINQRKPGHFRKRDAMKIRVLCEDEDAEDRWEDIVKQQYFPQLSKSERPLERPLGRPLEEVAEDRCEFKKAKFEDRWEGTSDKARSRSRSLSTRARCPGAQAHCNDVGSNKAINQRKPGTLRKRDAMKIRLL
jgi:hypothetical protein